MPQGWETQTGTYMTPLSSCKLYEVLELKADLSAWVVLFPSVPLRSTGVYIDSMQSYPHFLKVFAFGSAKHPACGPEYPTRSARDLFLPSFSNNISLDLAIHFWKEELKYCVTALPLLQAAIVALQPLDLVHFIKGSYCSKLRCDVRRKRSCCKPGKPFDQEIRSPFEEVSCCFAHPNKATIFSRKFLHTKKKPIFHHKGCW